jgi:hypothetical protein
MDPHPLGISPGAEIEHCFFLILIWILVGRHESVQLGDQCLKLGFEPFQLGRDSLRVHAPVVADTYLDILHLWFTAESANVVGVATLGLQTLHDEDLPIARQVDGWNCSLARLLDNLLQDSVQISP